jgi:Xaa-Pro aminopeptidase
MMNAPRSSVADERMCNPLSVAELERRWGAARTRMKSAGLDALLVQGFNSFSGGGYFRWFTGLAAGVGNPNTLIVPVEGLMTLVCHGDEGGARTLEGRDPAFPGIGRRLTVPNFPSAFYLSDLDPKIVAQEVHRLGIRSLGRVGSTMMYHGFAARLDELLTGITLTDATSMIDEIKAVKSAEEIELIRQAAAMQDAIMAKLPDFIRPGVKDYQVAAQAMCLGQMLGGEGGHFHAASAPADAPAVIRQRQQQGREIRKGDVFFFQCENSGPGGYYVHLARGFVLGKAPQPLKDMVAAAVDAQTHTLSLLRPNVSGREAFAAYNKFLRERGLPEERRLHCHGQGYDTVERPLLRPEESMAILPGMNIGIHPGFVVAGRFATICDNFLIGADGTPERLSHTPVEIFEI